MSKTFAAVAALTFILASSAASAQMLKTADTPKGKTFVDTKGMTRYTSTRMPAASRCVTAPVRRTGRR
jgi:predicted lipoprotein with Yx(FWY)xxD motif